MTVPAQTSAPPSAGGQARATAPDTLPVGGVLLSEVTKLRSVRSTWWTLACTFGMMVGFGALFSFAFVSRYDRLPPYERLHLDPTLDSLRGMFLAQLAIGVLGVLAITNEYATGMIRNTLAAVPQRTAVLTAKLVVFSAAAFSLTLISSFAAFAIGQSILSQKHVQASLGDPGVARAVIGCAVYLVGVGLLGMALGVILRRTAGAIAALVGLVIILPILAQALPSPWNSNVSKVLPGGAGQAIVAVRQAGDSLGPGAGLAVFCAYLAVALVAAFTLMSRRDV